MLGQKDRVSAFPRRDIKSFSSWKEMDILFQEGIRFFPKSEFFFPESLVPSFLISSHIGSISLTALLLDFTGVKRNFKRKKVFS
jgi:hypothetical protein